MSGLLRWANRTVLVVSLGLALLAAGVAGVLADGFDFQMLLTFWLALFILPLTALTGLRRAAMRGLHRVVTGQLPESIIRPLLYIALVGCAYLFLSEDLNASWAVGMNVVTASVAFLIGTQLLSKALPQAVKKASPVYQTRVWTGSVLPMVFISGMQIINSRADILILGAIKGSEVVGLYSVASRGAELVTFVLIAVNTALAPSIASLYATGDMKRLQRVVTKSARVVLFGSLPIAVGFVIFGRWFLLLFGSGFTPAYLTLVILSFSQLVNAAMGSVALLLIMTGYERDVALGMGMSAALNVILNAILIPHWGLEGAATATASSRIIWNLVLVVWVYKRLRIYSTALGEISLRQEG
jgi:O-antigen/teichoic acid export membrane protein